MAFCEVATRELVLVDSSNTISLIPLTNTLTGARLDMSGVTLVEVCIGGVEGDSGDSPSPVSWAEEEIDGVDTWVITIKAGLIPALPVGEQTMRVTVFDAANPEGLVITHDLPVEVIAPC